MLCVSWNDAKAFCEWLSGKEIRRYMLPTEARWEYSCRAGSHSAFAFGDDAAGLSSYAWYRENSLGKSHPVGQLRANAWGLYDMHGNAWEWCGDWYADGAYKTTAVTDPVGSQAASGRVLRGGGWLRIDDAARCRSAGRNTHGPSVSHSRIGFRVVCEVP